ncbi:MAG: class I SAM-dependent methyltransferase [Clostridia bacterium]
MYISHDFRDYEIIDAGDGEKLERWGNVILSRPEPQAIWSMESRISPDAHYIRASTGGGRWEFNKTLPEKWRIRYKNLTFVVRPTGFKHTGLFPEQAANWDYVSDIVKSSKKPPHILNLFAYTGGVTVALLKAGAEVTHVDAAKGMIAWAKENAELSGVLDAPVRFIVDDCMKFVMREQRRGHLYDGIIMDPPSYGRGPNGEMWKIETDLYPLIVECVKLLSDDALFFLINSYTTGFAPGILTAVLKAALSDRRGICQIESDEIGLPITRLGLTLPCGASGRALFI